MSKITLLNKSFDGQYWDIKVCDERNGTFVGTYRIELPEDATEDALVAAYERGE